MKNAYKTGFLILLVGLTAVVTSSNTFGQSRPTLDPALVPKFENAMPVIQDAGLRVDLRKGGKINVQIMETEQDLLGMGTLTTVWGYKFPGLPITYPGATIVAEAGHRVNIRWENNLPWKYDNFPNTHLLPVDPTLHMAMPTLGSGVPIVTHLHGGHTESASDGLPEAWYTRDYREKGNGFVKRDHRYDNTQEAAALWYHDHAMGITRLNVYAGLAGFYLLRDENENKLTKNNTLPSGGYEVEVVIQDRMFDAETHQLYFPAYPGDPSYDDFIYGEGATPPEGPSVLAEFFGDIILVNGKAWPQLSVEPRKYRIRLLNGSDSRFYVLSLKDELPWFQIGTDAGFLTQAMPIPDPVSESGPELVIAPGERMDLILDFTGKDGQEFILWNYGPDEPFGGDVDTNIDRPTAQIMKFVVNKPLIASIAEASIQVGTPLRSSAMPPLPAEFVPAQQNLVLFEATDEYGRLKPQLGTLSKGSLLYHDPITENPQLNETQVWEFFNATMDAHPIHLHLVAFQVLGRGAFTGMAMPRDVMPSAGMLMSGGALDFHLGSRDSWRGPEPNELGWKDTHIVYPGEFSQVRATFDRAGRYAWHCHILSHEDHEMMRPFYVGPIPQEKGKMHDPMVQAFPNPLVFVTTITFEIIREESVAFMVYDMAGELRYQHAAVYEPGKHALLWDGRDNQGIIIPNGFYLYKLKGESFGVTKRLTIKR